MNGLHQSDVIGKYGKLDMWDVEVAESK